MELKAYRIKGVKLGYFHDVYIKSEADCEIRRQKRKRCLAMAEMCEAVCYWFAARFDHHGFVDNVKWKLYDRWRIRWGKLAYKFKDDV